MAGDPQDLDAPSTEKPTKKKRVQKRRERRPAKTGMLLVDKPGGMTSHDVVQIVRRTFGQREVGHTGTLDPMATGLMVLTLGRATRLGRFLEAEDKSYEGTVVLGRATTTFDAEGETTDEAPIDGIGAEDVARALASLTGRIAQTVPAYSAVKVDGVRLHERARRGETVEAPTRTVTIASLTASRIALPEIDIAVAVSKGTYIRTLAVQIGAALGVPAHLSRLVRTSVGGHRLEAAHALDRLEGIEAELIPPTEALPHLPQVVLGPADLEDVRHGRPLTAGQMRTLGAPAMEEGDPCLLVTAEGRLAAVGLARLGDEGWAGVPACERAIGYACVLDTPAPQP